jgi:hypothetical protein
MLQNFLSGTFQVGNQPLAKLHNSGRRLINARRLGQQFRRDTGNTIPSPWLRRWREQGGQGVIVGD